jgi:2'-5' RNA ligase
MALLSVCLLLDERADATVRRLWRQLEADDVRTLASHTHGRHAPHLTLAALESADVEAVRRALGGLADGWRTDVEFQALGVFTRSRCWLLPAASVGLLDRQAAVVAALAGSGLAVHRHYRPASWLPHLTLAPRLRVETLTRVAQRVFDALPLPATLLRTVVVETRTGDIHDLP